MYNNGAGYVRSMKQTVTNWKTKRSNQLLIQISDNNTDYYDMYVNNKNIRFNYGSPSAWQGYADKRLDTVNNVWASLSYTYYTYIMVGLSSL